MKVRNKAVRGAVLALAIAGAVFTPAGPASADASGCTLAPGSLGSIACVEVKGTGTWVSNMRSVYNTNVVSYSNVCRPESWFAYDPNNAGRTYVYRSSSNCSLVRAWLDHAPNRRMDRNTTACAKQKNTFSGSWSNYACITVRS